MKELLINSKTHGIKTVLVDEEDFDTVSQYVWNIQKSCNTFYAIRHIYKEDGSQSTQKMHRLLMGTEASGNRIDHKDGNGLNNQRSSNLRLATNQENCRNTYRYKNNKSGAKGVSWHGRRNKWVVYICTDGKNKNLGYFYSKEAASLAYELTCLQTFGDFYKPSG